MKFTSLVLPSPDPDRLASFYRSTLHLPTVQLDDGSWEISAGHSRVRIVSGGHGSGGHHLAFSIPRAKFPAAKSWVGARTDLVTRDGEDEFEFAPPFGPATSFYFFDSDGSLLEFIGRAAPTFDEAAFDPAADLIGLAEVAVPVTSVSAAVARLRSTWALSPVLDEEGFAAVGDAEGMFILVSPDRAWFPTQDLRPEATPLTVGVSLEEPGIALSVRFSNNTVAKAT